MRYFLTFLLLCLVVFSKAQVVNIPDYYFKLLVVSQYDTSGDGEIQVGEALAIKNLQITPYYIWSGSEVQEQNPENLTGIEAFANLESLEIIATGTKEVNVSHLNKLKRIKSGGSFTLNKLTKLNVTGCTGLDSLQLYGENFFLDSLDLGTCSNLHFVECYSMYRMKSLVLQGCTNLRTLRLGMVGCYHYNFTGLTNLEEIGFWSDVATEINFFIDWGSGIFNKLRKVDIQSAWISNLDFSKCTNLDSLSLQWVGLSERNMDLSNAANLKHLTLSAGYHQDSVNKFNALNLKNGSRLSDFRLDTSCHFQFICADEFEVDTLRHYFANHGQVVNVNSYCSFYPGGNYNTITGKLKLDINNNGCSNSNRPMAGVPLRFIDTTGQSIIIYSKDSGNYAAYTYKGQFTFAPYFPYPFFSFNPVTAAVSFDTANHLVNTTNFCLQPNGIHNDLEITVLPNSAARPGFAARYIVAYKNRGTTTLSGNVQLNYDNNKMNFSNASATVTAQTTGQLVWNYNNLQPFESKTIDVTFNLLPPPFNNNGDTITYLAAITPSVNDETAFDNSFILPQRLVGSFDPNDKQCLEGSNLDISKIGSYLHYQVHFQNEGTDTAFNIVVADTLSDKSDWNSFELIGSSHPVNVKLTNNKAEFIFQNINLPYKAINEPGSNGWVAFKIKPKPSVVIGDSLNNKAAIYFDFNLPVITNTATTIVSSSSTPVPVKLEYFSVNQKNNTNTLNWKASCTYGNASFIIERSEDGIHFSSIGNVTATSLRCELPFNFTDYNPAAGKNYYRLKIMDAGGISFYSNIIAAGNNKAGLEIIAVANNTVYFSSNKQQTVQLKVLAADGKIILDEKEIVTAGSSNINLPLKNAARGIYILTIYTNTGAVITKRFTK